MSIDSDVFEKLGRAILAAQSLEESLVRENLALDPQADVLNAEAVAKLEESLKAQNLGELLKSWRAKVPKDQSLFDYLKNVKDDRNLLAHRLFRDARFKSSDDYKKEISRINGRLRTAQFLIHGHNPHLANALDETWGLIDGDKYG
jgi:hypothetical protein